MESHLCGMPTSFLFELPTAALNKEMNSNGRKLFIYSVSCDPFPGCSTGVDSGWVYGTTIEDARRWFGDGKSLISIKSWEDIQAENKLKNSVLKI